MQLIKRTLHLPSLVLAALALPISAAQAENVTLTFSNLAAANGPALTPLFIALHDGTFDAFDAGNIASSAIEAIAELGDGSGLASAFSAGHTNGISATVTASLNAFGPGVFLPGASGSITLNLDPVKNRYLSYFAMVVPSNDRFIGNDSPTEIELFDDMGHFLGLNHFESVSSIWDAGSETDGSFGAAFVVGSDALAGNAQNGVIALNDDFAVYSGLATPAGYNFNPAGANTPLLSITAVSQVPVPAAAWLFGSVLPAMGLWRRRKSAA